VLGWPSDSNGPLMSETNRWLEIIDNDPDHSKRYIERFEKLAREGMDLNGEARLIDAMANRGSRILDAGCGPGRVGGKLFELGHTVVGIDIDPVLIEAAKSNHPGPTWIAGDLATIDMTSELTGGNFDCIVCAGNVMRFLAPETRRDVLANFRRALASDGRAVIGFGSGGGPYDFSDYLDDVAAVDLTIDLKRSTWDLRSFSEESEFLVTVLAIAR
jgi:SAM-dependent methyltransferase